MDPKIMKNSLRFVEEIDFKEIELIETVGKGAFGVVSKGKWRDLYVAVKMIETASEQTAFVVEVRQLSRVSHPNIVKLYGACIESPVCLVMEFAEGGSLYNVLHTDSHESSYTMGHAMSWALQCACGVEYLHNMKPKALVHRDLKPPNLLLVNRGITLKICDFGTACDLHSNMTNSRGSAAWMAPEVFEGIRYTEKCDVYSWAIILWEVLTRQKPFDNIGGSAYRIMWAVHTGKRPPLIKGCPEPLENLITSCWAKDPSLRPSIAKAVEIMSFLCKFFSGAETPVLPHFQEYRHQDSRDCSCSRSDCSLVSSLNSPLDITIVEKQLSNKNVDQSPNNQTNKGVGLCHLRVSNTAPGSLANSRENLNNSDSSSASPNSKTNAVDGQQKRKSADLSNIFEPQPVGKSSGHKRTSSYEPFTLLDVNSAPIQQSAPRYPPSRRSISFCSPPQLDQQPNYRHQRLPLSPDTGRGSSLSSSATSSNLFSSLNSFNNKTYFSSNIGNVDMPKRYQEFSNLDASLQPLAPVNNDEESQVIYEKHCKLAKDYSRVEMEIKLLSTRKEELYNELMVESRSEGKKFDYYQEFVDLQTESQSLVEAYTSSKYELDKLRCGLDASGEVDTTNSAESEEGWVVVYSNNNPRIEP